MRIKVDEQSISRLIEVVEKFEDKLRSKEYSEDETRRTRDTLADTQKKNMELEKQLSQMKMWRDSLEARNLQEETVALDARDKELTAKKKEIEDLAYNKGYVAGYVEITQKLGKSV